MPTRTGNIFAANLANDGGSKNSIMVLFSRMCATLSILSYLILHVVLARPFEQMTRVKAWRIIASVERTWGGVMAVSQLERQPMHGSGYAVNVHNAVTSNIAAIRPNEAFIRGVGFENFLDPLKKSFIAKLRRHRCSSKASVLGRSSLRKSASAHLILASTQLVTI
jgi:hypothetical protein